MHTTTPTLQDPREISRPMSAGLRRLIMDKLVDERDAPLVLDALVSSLVIPIAALLFVPGVFSWPLAAVYLLLVVPRLGPNAVLVHMVTHRRLFKPTWGRYNDYIPLVLACFYGMSPGAYLAHHLGMHHVEGNMPGDRSSTMRFRRDSLVDFCRYWLRFQLLGKLDLYRYLRAHRREKLVRRLLWAEALHKGGLLALALLSWQAALVVVVLPYCIIRWGVMMGNWGQHAFIDPTDPASPYKSSVTLINCPYNGAMYNDGYHCGHHIKATTHWADAPAAFEASIDRYAENQAIVFDGIRGFQQLWVLLMGKRYETLARHMVQWGDTPMPLAERVALLKARLQPIPTEPAETVIKAD